MGKAEGGRVKPGSHIAWRRVEDEIVILDLNSSVYYSVNPVGAMIWELLAKGKDAGHIVKEMTGEWDVDEAAARRDLSAFLKHVKKFRLTAK